MADSSADRDPLDRLAEEFVARFRAGERPSLTEYAARLPGREEEVRDLFPALVEMEQLKPATADHTGDYAPPPGPTDPPRVGEFRVLRRVGVGGMGVVYEAVQESLGRHVALKLLPADALADPRRLERFRREAKAAAKLHHTNIVPVFGTGEADGRHYYAMQFIAGHPLDAVIDEVRRLKDKSATPRAVSEVAAALATGTFPHAPESPPVATGGPESPSLSGSLSDGHHYWTTVARIGAQAADALANAHAQGVLHRDIKPANLLLDLQGTVWVTDFGLAKSSDADDLTHAGDVVGTLRYLAPERFDGAGDHRADVYALGLTLYELLTLRPAFHAENRAKLVEQVTAANPPKPRSIDPSIPRDLETIVLKAIQRDPALRYQSSADLADDLRRYVEDRPIRARRASSSEQAWRWCRRNPAVASLIAAVVLVTTLGAAAAAAFAVRADSARRDADAKRLEAEAARQAEAEQKTIAQAKEAEANAVVKFFEEKVFAAARPKGQDGGLGRDVTLRDAVAAGLPALANSFADQPLVEARLRMTLGNTFALLGDPKTGAEQNERARSIYARWRGRHHPDTLACINNLAITYSELARHGEAIVLFEEALAARKQLFPPDHPDTLSSMSNLSFCYLKLGRYAEALDLCEEALTARQRTLPPNHPETLTSMNNLGNCYAGLGRHADALELFQKTLAARKQILPPDHLELLTTMNDLADTHSVLGHHSEAIEFARKTVRGASANLGPVHPQTLFWTWTLVEVLSRAGRSAETVPIIDDCVRRAVGQPVDPRLVPEVMTWRLRHSQNAADPAGCRATAAMWEGLNRPAAADLYTAARFRAVAAELYAKADQPAEAAADADRAVAWLTKALAAGYADRFHMGRDKDLDYLRSRADFQALLVSLPPNREAAPWPRTVR